MLHVILLVQLITIVTGFLCLRRERPVILCMALGITILAMVNEHIVISFLNNFLQLPRNIYYNIFSIIDISCWSAIFYYIFTNRPKIRRLTILSGAVVMLYTLIELFVTGTLKQFHSNSFLCFNTMITMLSLIYILGTYKRSTQNVWQDHALWLSAAALVFNGMFFVNLLGLIDRSYWSQPAALHTFHIVQYTAIVIYHLLLCISFISLCYRYRPVATHPL